MKIVSSISEMQNIADELRRNGKRIGVVPTMGYLHDGHLSLIRIAKQHADIVVTTIFVNPAQFAPNEDFNKYPRDTESDIAKVRDEGADILFLPDNTVIYPEGFSTYINVDGLSEKLCGRSRPGHFRGVTTVVAKLVNIINPTRAYFGQKDFQQTVIIKKMVRDLNFSIDVVVCPTVREHDGLAMSSRNAYLDEEQRKAASVIYKSLSMASDSIKSGIIKTDKIKELMLKVISEEALITDTDYASVYNPETLDEMTEVHGDVLIAVAVRMGTTRLIDNVLINT